jgi:dissimilatory sulfite reductase (desulfoviridin) alpha/beta subunit
MGCVHACREGAVSHPGLLPIVDPKRCLRCGACTRVCLSGTLQVGRRGWRVQVGGRLGRHPSLARELPGLHSSAGVLAVVDCCLEHYLRHARAGERFGEVLDRTGPDELAACVAARGQAAGEEPVRKPAPILRGPV